MENYSADCHPPRNPSTLGEQAREEKFELLPFLAAPPQPTGITCAHQGRVHGEALATAAAAPGPSEQEAMCGQGEERRDPELAPSLMHPRSTSQSKFSYPTVRDVDNWRRPGKQFPNSNVDTEVAVMTPSEEFPPLEESKIPEISIFKLVDVELHSENYTVSPTSDLFASLLDSDCIPMMENKPLLPPPLRPEKCLVNFNLIEIHQEYSIYKISTEYISNLIPLDRPNKNSLLNEIFLENENVLELFDLSSTEETRLLPPPLNPEIVQNNASSAEVFNHDSESETNKLNQKLNVRKKYIAMKTNPISQDAKENWPPTDMNSSEEPLVKMRHVKTQLRINRKYMNKICLKYKSKKNIVETDSCYQEVFKVWPHSRVISSEKRRTVMCRTNTHDCLLQNRKLHLRKDPGKASVNGFHEETDSSVDCRMLWDPGILFEIHWTARMLMIEKF